jgi:phage shock protein C
MKEKKLYKSASDRKISGVCGGIAEYIGIDATLVRLLWVIFTLMGPGIIAYVVCAIIVPEQPPYYNHDEGQDERHDERYDDENDGRRGN